MAYVVNIDFDYFSRHSSGPGYVNTAPFPCTAYSLQIQWLHAFRVVRLNTRREERFNILHVLVLLWVYITKPSIYICMVPAAKAANP